MKAARHAAAFSAAQQIPHPPPRPDRLVAFNAANARPACPTPAADFEIDELERADNRALVMGLRRAAEEREDR